MASAASLQRDIAPVVPEQPVRCRPEEQPSGLTRIERLVVEIAAHDARRNIRPVAADDRSFRGRVQRLAECVRGRRDANALADARLETLRRFAQAAARGREQICDLKALRDAGFSAAQIVLTTHLSRLAYDGAPTPA